MSDLEAPGLRVRPRRDGPAYYWVATAVSRKAAKYPTKTVRLHYATNEERAKRCQTLTAELKAWLDERGEGEAKRFNGTMASLVDCYQTDPDSPFHEVRQVTRGGYTHDLRIIKRTVGTTIIEDLTRADFARWYRNFKAPDKPDGHERIRRGHGLLTMVRIIMKFGAGMKYDGCRDAAAILADMRFETPAAREAEMTFAQASAIVDKALDLGLRSIALGQALQFDLGLRQADVIGIWESAADGQAGIVFRKNRWNSGVLWSDINANGTLRKKTSKTSTLGEWHLPSFSLVSRVLAGFPAEERVGPMVIDEATGRPYQRHRYSRMWRLVATAAGVPASVWNRDSRAGAITEGSEAGAEANDLQTMATHADAATTRRYIRSTEGAISRVANLREEKRKRERK